MTENTTLIAYLNARMAYATNPIDNNNYYVDLHRYHLEKEGIVDWNWLDEFDQKIEQLFNEFIKDEKINMNKLNTKLNKLVKKYVSPDLTIETKIQFFNSLKYLINTDYKNSHILLARLGTTNNVKIL